MNEQERLAAPVDLHLEREFSIEQFLGGVHFALRTSAVADADARAVPLTSPFWKWTGAGIAISFCGIRLGDHLSSKSLHRSRMYGMTSVANIGYVLSAAWAFGSVVVLLVCRNSDRVGERKWHLLTTGLIAATAYYVLPLAHDSVLRRSC